MLERTKRPSAGGYMLLIDSGPAGCGYIGRHTFTSELEELKDGRPVVLAVFIDTPKLVCNLMKHLSTNCCGRKRRF